MITIFNKSLVSSKRDRTTIVIKDFSIVIKKPTFTFNFLKRDLRKSQSFLKHPKKLIFDCCKCGARTHQGMIFLKEEKKTNSTMIHLKF